MTAMTARQADAELDRITEWVRGRQDVADLIEAIGYAQAAAGDTVSDELPAAERRATGLLFCDHLWCTLDAALADEITCRRGKYGKRVEDTRRADGRKPIPREVVTTAATYVPEAIMAVVSPPPTPTELTTALRILAAWICPTPEAHTAVIDGALEITAMRAVT